MAYSPNGSNIAVAGDNGNVYIIDANNPNTSPITTIPVQPGAPLLSLAYSPNNTSEIAVAGDNGKVYIIDANNPNIPQITTIPVSVDPLSSLAYNPNNTSEIAVAAQNGNVYIISGGTPIAIPVPPGAPLLSLAYSPNNTSEIAVASDNGDVYIISGGTPVIHVPPGAPLLSLAYSPNGSNIAVAGDNGNVYIIDANNPNTSPITTIPVSGTPLSSLAYNPNNTSEIAVAAQNGNVYILKKTVYSIAGPTAVCAGTDVTLTASPAGAASYLWNGPNGTSTTNPLVITDIQEADEGSYTVTVTDANGCTGTASTNLIVNSVPTPSIAGPTAVCAGTDVTLTASPAGAASYLWNGPNGTSTTNPLVITDIQEADEGSYDVTVTDANGCTGTASTNLTVTTVSPSIAGPTAVCAGTDVTLTASPAGAASYLWNGPNGTSTTNPLVITDIQEADEGSYTVTVTDANGCTGTASTSLTVNSVPTPSIAGPTAVCAGTDVTLTASPAGAASYLWNGPNGTSTTNPLVITDIQEADEGSYDVTVTDANGCTGTASTNLIVNSVPTPSIAGPTAVCAGTDVTLTASPAGAASYLWNGPNGTSTTNPLVITDIQEADEGSYTVTVTDANGCTGTASTNLIVNSIPTPSIAGPTSVCAGTDVTLTASPAGAAGYLWNGPNGTSTTNPLVITDIQEADEGSYDVTVTDANGCTGTASTNLIVNSIPTPSIAGPTSVCAGTDVTLTASPAGAASYLWNGPNGTSTTNPLVITDIQEADEGSYTVTVTDANGCTGTASTSLTVNTVPPTASISGDSSVCQGSSTTLAASTDATSPTYQWLLNGNTISGATDQTFSTSISLTPNDYDYTVKVTDNSTGCTSTSDQFTVTVIDCVPEEIINIRAIILPSNTPSSNFISISGTVSDSSLNGQTVQLFQDGESVASTVVNNGEFSFDRFELNAGNYTFQIRSQDEEIVSNTLTIFVPTNVSINIEQTDSTVIVAGNVTSSTRSVRSGKKFTNKIFRQINPGEIVYLYANGNLIDQTTINSNGSFSLTFPVTSLTPGIYTFQARTTDEFGNLVLSNIVRTTISPIDTNISLISQAIRNKYCPQISPIVNF